MITVHVVSGLRLYRDAIEMALRESAVIEVVGSSGHAIDVIAGTGRGHPHVVVLDLPGPEGPRWAALLREALPYTGLVVLGVREAEHEVDPWAEAGAVAYLGLEATSADVIQVIERVGQGRSNCSSQTKACRVARIAPPSTGHAGRSDERPLTAREREVLDFVGQGLTNQQIGSHLFISLATVKNHVHNILEKLEVHRRVDAVREIRRGGLLLVNAPSRGPAPLPVPSSVADEHGGIRIAT